MRTLKELKEAKIKNRIRITNDQIIEATVSMWGVNTTEINILLNTKNGKSLSFPVRKLSIFRDIFIDDKNGGTFTQLNEYEGQYIRVIEYLTPEEEMHQLSDKIEKVGITHILSDRLFIFEGDRLYVNEFEK